MFDNRGVGTCNGRNRKLERGTDGLFRWIHYSGGKKTSGAGCSKRFKPCQQASLKFMKLKMCCSTPLNHISMPFEFDVETTSNLKSSRTIRGLFCLNFKYLHENEFEDMFKYVH